MVPNAELAFGGTAPMLGLIESIYAAVQQPELWEPVLDQISRAVQGESIALYAGAPDARSPAIVAFQGAADDVWERYAAYYAAINPIYPACQRVFSPTETWYSDRALNDTDYEKTEFYNDFYKPNKAYYSMGLLIDLGDAPAASISIQRQHAWGPFPEAAEIVAQTLRPHLQRALLLHHQMGAMQTAVLGLETALEAYEHAVIGVDGQGRMKVCNPSALKLVEIGDGVRMVQGRLSCALTEDNRSLQGMLSNALMGGVGGALLVHRARKPPLRVAVSPFRGVLPGRAVALAALVFVSDPALAVESRSTVMSALYGLTPAEGRVADLLLEGLEVRELAARLRITLETARFHVKRVLAKTGARRQSELMRLMLALPGVR